MKAIELKPDGRRFGEVMVGSKTGRDLERKARKQRSLDAQARWDGTRRARDSFEVRQMLRFGSTELRPQKSKVPRSQRLSKRKKGARKPKGQIQGGSPPSPRTAGTLLPEVRPAKPKVRLGANLQQGSAKPFPKER